MRTYHLPGLTACIVHNGQISWKGNFGYADITENKMVNDSTLFLLSSVSKTVTATAIMQLWEQGKFFLDDNINDYLPQDVQVVNPNSPQAIITFRMLMSHTSSIADNWDMMKLFSNPIGDPTVTLAQAVKGYFNPSGVYYDSENNFFQWAPGENYEYSNMGIALIGFLVEVISDTSFYVFCDKHIFIPLDMKKTGWFLSQLDTNDIARPYSWDGSEYIPYPHYGYADYPDGQLRTSALQLARFLTCYMNDGKFDNRSILKSATIDTMLTIHYPAISAEQGLIWHQSGARWGHEGEDSGSIASMFFNAVADKGVIVLSNGETFTGLSRISEKLFRIDITTVDSEAENQRAFFSLKQNYPNPFNASTKILYYIKKPGFVNLKIYNSLGKEIQILVDEFQNRGSYSRMFETSNLSSGIYFYILEVGDFSETRKMVLLR